MSLTAQGKPELHYLPGYAPELNPDELVWDYMKRTATARRPLGMGEVLQEHIEASYYFLDALNSNS